MDDLGHGDSINTENERALYRRLPLTGEWGVGGDGAQALAADVAACCPVGWASCNGLVSACARDGVVRLCACAAGGRATEHEAAHVPSSAPTGHLLPKVEGSGEPLFCWTLAPLPLETLATVLRNRAWVKARAKPRQMRCTVVRQRCGARCSGGATCGAGSSRRTGAVTTPRDVQRRIIATDSGTSLPARRRNSRPERCATQRPATAENRQG